MCVNCSFMLYVTFTAAVQTSQVCSNMVVCVCGRYLWCRKILSSFLFYSNVFFLMFFFTFVATSHIVLILFFVLHCEIDSGSNWIDSVYSITQFIIHLDWRKQIDSSMKKQLTTKDKCLVCLFLFFIDFLISCITRSTTISCLKNTCSICASKMYMLRSFWTVLTDRHYPEHALCLSQQNELIEGAISEQQQWRYLQVNL